MRLLETEQRRIRQERKVILVAAIIAIIIGLFNIGDIFI